MWGGGGWGGKGAGRGRVSVELGEEGSERRRLLTLCAVKVQHAYWARKIHLYMGDRVSIESLVPGLFGHSAAPSLSSLRVVAKASTRSALGGWRRRSLRGGGSPSPMDSRAPMASTTPDTASARVETPSRTDAQDGCRRPPSTRPPSTSAGEPSSSPTTGATNDTRLDELTQMIRGSLGRIESKVAGLDASVTSLGAKMIQVEAILSTTTGMGDASIPEVTATIASRRQCSSSDTSRAQGALSSSPARRVSL